MKLHIEIEERPTKVCFVFPAIPDSIIKCRLETTPQEAARIKKYNLDMTELCILPHNGPDMKTPPLHLFQILNTEFERKFNRPEQAVQTKGEIIAACKRIKETVESYPDDHTGSTIIDL